MLNKPERVIIVFREPFDKSYYSFPKQERTSFRMRDIHEYYQIVWTADDYYSYKTTDQGVLFEHPTGTSFYPWSAIQEFDVMKETEKSHG